MATVGTPQKSRRGAASKNPEELVQQALENIPQHVAEYCTPFFSTELKPFLSWLNETDQRLTVRPEEASTPTLRREVDMRWTDIIRSGEAAVAPIHKTVDKKAVKEGFRSMIKPWIGGNPFIERAIEKPRGYPGDYLMMERFYIGQHELSGGLAGVLDRFLLDHYACVPNRKNRSKETIRRHVARLAGTGAPIRIMSLGSGPCREWFELEQELDGQERKFFASVQLTCVDQDADVLDFCRQRFERSPLVHKVEYVKSGLLGFTKAEEWINRAGTFDLVYGFGIADYFHDEMLSSVITSGFALLKEGGEVSIPHKSDAGFNYELADWICDWTFVKRTEQQYVDLFRDAVSSLRIPFEFSMDRDPTRAIMFGTATRQW